MHADAGAVVTATGRGGRFRPWIARMAVPVAVASALLYAPFITDWAYPAKLDYAVATYLLWGSIYYTTTNISYGAMVSVISDDPDQHSSLPAFRGLGAVFYFLCYAGVRERIERRG